MFYLCQRDLPSDPWPQHVTSRQQHHNIVGGMCICEQQNSEDGLLYLRRVASIHKATAHESDEADAAPCGRLRVLSRGRSMGFVLQLAAPAALRRSDPESIVATLCDGARAFGKKPEGS